MPEEWLIFPRTRRLVSELAKICGLCLLISAAGIGGILLFAAGADNLGAGLWQIADLCLPLHLLLLSLLMLWCHDVLLSGRGLGISRFLLAFCALQAGLYVVCSFYTLLPTNELLLPLQELLPCIVWAILAVCTLLNLGNMAALPTKWKCLLFAYFLLLLPVLLTRNTELFLIAELAKIPCAACGFFLFRALSRLAPRIISLPSPGGDA